MRRNFLDCFDLRQWSASAVVVWAMLVGLSGHASASRAAEAGARSWQQPGPEEDRQAAMAARKAKLKAEQEERDKKAAEQAAQAGGQAPPPAQAAQAAQAQAQAQQRQAQEQQQRQAQEQQQRQAQEQQQRQAQEQQQRQAQEQQQRQAQEQQQRQAQEQQQRQAQEQQRRQAQEWQQRQAQEQQQRQAQEWQQRQAQEQQQRQAQEWQQRQAQEQQQRQAQEQQQRQAQEQQQRQAQEQQQRQAQTQAQQEDQQRQAGEWQQRQAQERQQRQAQFQAQHEAQQRQAQMLDAQQQGQGVPAPYAQGSGPQPLPPGYGGNAAPQLDPVVAPVAPVAPVAQVAPVAPAIGADGRNVTEVGYAIGGQTRGAFRQVGAGQWQETAAGGGSSFQFRETGRDDWSVYLIDDSRGANIQLDLHRKLVLYSDNGGGGQRSIYDINFARAGAVPQSAAPPAAAVSAINANGHTVTDATFGGGGQTLGHYRQVGPGQWREEPSNGGAGFQFQETGRDEWSVYLIDSARGVNIQLDLHRKLVLYSDNRGGGQSSLYEITAANAGAVSPVAGSSPSQYSSQSPSQYPSQSPSQYPSQSPSQYPSQSPSQYPSQSPSQYPSQSPSQYPSQSPSPADTGLAGGAGDSNSAIEKEFCWKDSIGRGVGTIPQSCPAGRERIGLLCYTTCPANMARFGFDCHSVCPSGMRNDGLFCRSSEYARTPYVASPSDLFGPSNRERCEKKENGKCEKAVGDAAGTIFYVKCKSGYSSWPLGICRPPQPNCAALGMGGQFDLSCAKTVIIGDPVTGSCPAGQQSDGGLCYPKCEAGYTGVGPVCWTGAPSNWVECGMGAAKDSFTCGHIVFGQVASVGQLAFNIATFPTGAGAAAGAATAASKAERLTKLKSMYQTLKTLYKQNEQAIKLANATRKTGVAIKDDIALVDDDVVTEEDIIRIAAEIAAIADPTGVAGAVASYTYPKCSKYNF